MVDSKIFPSLKSEGLFYGDYLNGNPRDWMSAQDGQGFTWYQVGFPSSRAYGWVRGDFVSLPPAQCRD